MGKRTGFFLAMVAVATAGFVTAAIASGGNLAQLLDTTTGASTSTGTGPTGTQPPPPRRVLVCHVTQGKKRPGVTIVVPQPAVAAHLRHGDTTGPCPPPKAPPPPGAPTTGTATTASGPSGPSGPGNPGRAGGNGNGQGNAGGHRK